MSYSKDANIYLNKMSLQIQSVWCTGQLLAGEIFHLVYLQDLFLRHDEEMPFAYKGVRVAIVLTGRLCRSYKKSAAYIAQEHV